LREKKTFIQKRSLVAGGRDFQKVPGPNSGSLLAYYRAENASKPFETQELSKLNEGGGVERQVRGYQMAIWGHSMGVYLGDTETPTGLVLKAT